MRPRLLGHGWHRPLFAACAAWLALYELKVLLAPDLNAGVLTARGAHDVVLVVASLLCLARGVVGARSERPAWLLIGAGVLAWSVGEVYYTVVLWDAEVIAIPSPADIGYLLLPPLVLTGVALLLRARTRDLPRALLVDGVIAALSVAAVSAAIVFQTVLDSAEGQAAAVATNLAYPIGDLILLGLIVGALAGTGWRLDRTWMLLAIGVSTFWLADSLYLVRTANGTFESGGWIDTGWWIGLFLVAVAAWQPAPARRERPSEESLRLIAVPLAFGAVSLGLLVYGSLASLNLLAIVLAGLALVAVMARLTLTYRDNVAMLRTSRDEAMTDALTGLGNRRALSRELDEFTRDAAQGRHLVLALFDLDGFKHYNDTFGHPAGDALLVRLGASLAARLEGGGRAYRMGGDEFCALFDPGSEPADPIVHDAASALSEHGEGFSIGCSFGSVVLGVEATEAAEALRIADQRMYAFKQAGRMSAGRQSKDVLLRALTERNPELAGHLSGVADLAERTAERLGLPADEIQRVRHAAELHDAGKVAIPDAILNKPGPLEAEEWAFVRRHTLIGERIVAAAPALAHVAGLVRSSHERWDGAGYPDGMVAEAIPLGSRIVAVADAFDAMTAGRPYRPASPAAEAIEELRRCAGSQFDPAVVDAFCALWAERSVPSAV